MLVAAAAGALALVAARLDLVSGPARSGAGEAVSGAAGPGLVAALAAGTALAGAGVAVDRRWARLAGVLGATLVAFLSAAAVVTARSSSRIAADADVTLEAGGILMCVAFGGAALALVATLVAMRAAASSAGDGAAHRPDPGIAITANAALGVGLASLIVPVLAGVAVALGALAHGDIRRSRNQLEGLGRATAGALLGIFVLALVLVAGIAGIILVRPGD